jgi:DNA gyrase subunit A
MAPLAMEMVRDIDEETVDFQPNYDGKRRRSRSSCPPLPEPAGQRLARGSRSAWPPTSRRTTCARSPTACSGRWSPPDATPEELLEALIERVKGPDFPTGA